MLSNLLSLQAHDRELQQARRAEHSAWDEADCCRLCHRPRPLPQLDIQTEFGQITLLSSERKVLLDNAPIPHIRAQAFLVLSFLLSNPLHILSHKRAVAFCSSDALNTRAWLSVTICYIRQALCSFSPTIENVHGLGYRFNPFPSSSSSSSSSPSPSSSFSLRRINQ